MARLSFRAYPGRERRPTLTPTAAGVRQIAEEPDPNDPADLYRQRSGPQQSGAFGAGAAQQFAPPTPAGWGQNVMLRGSEQARQYEASERQRAIDEGRAIPVSSTLPDPQWQGLFQALFEQGAEDIADPTSRRAGGKTYRDPIATTLNYTQLPAGVSEERFTRDVDVAARGGRRPSYLSRETPRTKAKFERRFSSAQRALAEELRQQQEEGR